MSDRTMPLRNACYVSMLELGCQARAGVDRALSESVTRTGRLIRCTAAPASIKRSESMAVDSYKDMNHV